MSARGSRRGLQRLPMIGLAVLLTGCAGGRVTVHGDLTPIPHEPRSKYGNPASYVVHGKRYYVMDSAEGYVERGIASWYGPKFHGRKTSSGEVYDMHAMTAAHKTLPLPTYVRVTNLENGRSVVVKVNDRGPFVRNRIIDLSYAAAKALDIVRKGTGLVEIRALSPGRPAPAAPTMAALPDAPRQPLPVRPLAPAAVYIQVGAFASRQNAEQMRGQLILNGVEAVSVQAGENGVYRVRIGPLATVELADQTAVHLERIGLMNYQVVID